MEANRRETAPPLNRVIPDSPLFVKILGRSNSTQSCRANGSPQNIKTVNYDCSFADIYCYISIADIILKIFSFFFL